MLRYLTLAFVLFITGCASQSTELPDVQWVSLEQAQDFASIDGRKIMVDVYTDWCEFCKKLEETVYPDSTVRLSLNTFYHSVKLNGESDQEVTFNGETMSMYQFAQRLGVRSYPTILFIDSNGELILQINGFMPVTDFQNMLVFIGQEAYKKTEFHDFVVDRE
jgi:thioredoxin-related protein